MFLFVLSLLLVLVAIAAGVVSIVSREVRGPAVGVAVIAFLLGLGVFLSDTLTQVNTKNVGVVTEFGKPVGYLNNGLHFVAPWANVTEISDAVQTDTYASDGYNGHKQGGATDTCIHVRLAGSATACPNVSIRWQIKPSGVDYLFRNYQDTHLITDNLVLRDLQQAMNQAFADYNPLNLDENGNSKNPSFATISANVLKIVQQDIDQNNQGALTITSVIVPFMNYDEQTQARINEVLAQIAKTKTAIQAQQTATAQAAANKALAASVSNDPGVLISRCLDLTQNAIDKGVSLPPGWNCVGGGSGISVAVPAK